MQSSLQICLIFFLIYDKNSGCIDDDEMRKGCSVPSFRPYVCWGVDE